MFYASKPDCMITIRMPDRDRRWTAKLSELPIHSYVIEEDGLMVKAARSLRSPTIEIKLKHVVSLKSVLSLTQANGMHIAYEAEHLSRDERSALLCYLRQDMCFSESDGYWTKSLAKRVKPMRPL